MEAAKSPSAKPIRVGLVGLGKIARDQHIPAIAADPYFLLAATASPDGASAGVAAFKDLDAMLAAGLDLDAVVLCTPPGVRAGLAATALGAGLHVMLEKPPARSLAEASTLQFAGRADRTLFAAWHSREAAAVATAAAWLDGRRVHDVAMTWRESVYRWHPGQDWLLAKGGFGVFDPAINGFSILTRILPEPLAVLSADLSVPRNRASPVAATLAMRSGAAPVRCDLSILETGPQRWDIRVRTDRGELLLSEGGARLAIDGLPVAVAAADPADGEYPRLYRRFADLIARGESDFDLAPLAIVDAAQACGQVTPVEDFSFQ